MSNVDVIKIGDYIIIQRQKYRKLVKLNKPNVSINLGRDVVHLDGLEGCNFFSVFKMIPKGNRKHRAYSLELTQESVNLRSEIDIQQSGSDNRNIFDDGNSQKLSAAQIEEIKGDASCASDIVGTLISNSNTFHNKTEYSQDKYLKKKEKKYFEFIQIIQPTLRIISDIMYNLDPAKIQHLRLDSLSQIITQVNVYSDGNYLLYDSGSNGLMAAAILSSIGQGTNGKLINMHPGNLSQKQALQAMNLSQEQYERCISVNVYSVLRQIYQGCDTNDLLKDTESTKVTENENVVQNTEQLENHIDHNSRKRKASNNSDLQKLDSNNVDNNTELKKPKWHFDNLSAAELLQQKVDALVIVSKEDPQNIFYELLPFVKHGRPFVIFFNVAEPLQSLYLNLKADNRVAALKLSSNWMRNYQVLPDRTHPEVTMNNASGFILSGYILK